MYICGIPGINSLHAKAKFYESLQEPWWNLCSRCFSNAEAPEDETNVKYYEKLAYKLADKFIEMALQC